MKGYYTATIHRADPSRDDCGEDTTERLCARTLRTAKAEATRWARYVEVPDLYPIKIHFVEYGSSRFEPEPYVAVKDIGGVWHNTDS